MFNFVALLPLILQLLPYVIDLVKLAEQLFSGESKSGAAKKQFVLKSTEAIFDGMQGVSTGGQKETWTRLEAPVGKVVDGLASIFFKTHEDKNQQGPV